MAIRPFRAHIRQQNSGWWTWEVRRQQPAARTRTGIARTRREALHAALSSEQAQAIAA